MSPSVSLGATAPVFGDGTQLVTVDQVARTLGLSVRTVRRMDSAGKLPAPVRVGGSVRWRKADVAAWVTAGCPSRR